MEENKPYLQIRIKRPKEAPPLIDSDDGWETAQDEGEPSFNGDIDEIANVEYPKSTTPTCPECGRTFPSNKSLYGHLRSHKDRGYRGAHPPPMATKKHPYLEAGDSSAKSLPSVPKWPIAKRGRALPSDIVDEYDEHVVDAAHILMTMSAAEPVVIVNGLKTPEEGKRIVEKKKIEEPELENAESGACGRRYKCSVCMKSFSSHQALGGHKSSHRKNKNTNPKEEANGSIDLISHAASIYNSPEACGSGCPKEATHDPSPSAHSPDEIDHKKASYRVFDFDLNEIPKPEGGEEES